MNIQAQSLLQSTET